MIYTSKILVVATFIILAASCKTTETTVTGRTEQTPKEMLAQGYIKAQLKENSADGCPVLLLVDNEQLDPINLGEYAVEIPSEVWVKFGRLRMKNRCEQALPIKVDAIEKR